MMKMYSLKINIFGNRQRACLLIFLGVFHFSTLFAQTDLKVGTSPGLLSTSAVFEAASTTKGALIPRMTTAQMNAIASPALGLLVFNTDANCLYFYVSGWKSQCDPANLGAWSLLGNAGISSSNFLGSTNNAPLRFRTNNVERMILDSIGRVGIGTGSPLTPLHLYTDVSNNAFRISNSTNTGRTMSAFVENNGYSEINTAGSDLGIKAGYRLNLIGQGGAWGNVFSFAQTTATTHNNGTSFLRFDGNYAPSTAPTTVGDYRFFDINPIINQTGAANLDYSILDMNVTETSVLGANKYLAHWRTNGLSRFSVTSAGNVGIGTAAPKSQLDVYATSGGETRLSSNNTTKYGEIIFSSNNSGYLDRGASIEGNGNNIGLDVGQLIFKTQYGSSPRTERMRINYNGLVGIGTTTPAYKLDIDANTGSTGNPLRLQGLQAGATSDSLLTSASGVVRRLAINQLGNGNFWKIGGNTEGGVQNLGTTDNYALPFMTNNVERMRITEAGNIGIGKTAPSYKVDVSGWVAADFLKGVLSVTDNRAVIDTPNNMYMGLSLNFKNNSAIALTSQGTYSGVQTFRPYASGTLNGGDWTGGAAHQTAYTQNGHLLHRTGTINSWTNWRRIIEEDTLGNVGIGTLTPTHKLSVSGIMDADNIIVNKQAGQNKGFLTGAYIASNYWSINTLGSSNAIGQSMNRLMGANSGRYTITATNVATPSHLFNGYYNYYSTINAGVTGTIEIDVSPQLPWSANVNGGGITYTEGTIVLSSYHTYYPTNVTVEWYHSVGGVDTWETLYTTTTNDKNPLIIPVPSNTYLKKLRVSCSNPSQAVWLTELEYYSVRDNGYELSNIPAYSATAVDVGLSALQFRNSSWGIASRIANDGSAYFGNGSGNVGINNIAPSYKLDIDANTGSVGNPVRLQGLQAGATTDSLVTSQSGVLKRLAINQLGNGNFWKIGGNTEGGVQNLGTTDNYALPFLTNNVERMRITETGSIGIGTTSPVARLHATGVSGLDAAYFTTNGNSNALLIDHIGNAAVGNGIKVNSQWADNNGAIYINHTTTATSGSGTSAKGMKISGNYLHTGSTVSHNGEGLNIDVTNNAATTGILYGERITATSNSTGSTVLGLGVTVSSSSGTAYAATFNGGNVGIGISTPQYRLDIDAKTGSTGNPLRLQGLQAGATSDSLLTSASGVVKRLAINQLGNGNFWKIGGNTEGGVRNLGTTDNYALPFLTNNVERMRITETGSVGIGTSSPGLLLHVAASSGSQQGIYLSDGSNTDLRIYRDADVGNWSLLRSDVGNGIGIIGLPDIMSISVLRNTGYVGISTNTPQAKLDVNGKIISGSAVATGGSVILEGLYNQSTGAGALNILGASYSSGGTVLSYGGVPSASLRDSFTSSTNVALPRAAMILDGDINFLNATSQTLAIGTPISISSKMIIKTNGRVGIGTNAPSRKLELSVGDQDGIKVVSTGSARMDFTTAGGGGVIYSNNIGHYFQDDIGTNRVAILATGNTGIGVTTPSVKLDIDGAVAVRANAMNVTADNQAVTVGNRSYLKLTADGAPTSRTVTLSNGASEGQILIISIIGTGANGIELADSGNLNLSGTAQLDNGDTIQLIWDGTSWNEITRSYN